MARYRCTACGEYFATRNVSCPTDGCAGGISTYERADEPRGTSKAAIRRGAGSSAAKTTRLGSVDSSDRMRILTGVAEFDRVTGGGLVTGSLVLVAGEPGSGKTTLLTGVTDAMVKQGRRVIYVSGEESAGQIRLRAERLGLDLDALEVLCTDDAAAAASTIEHEKPDMAVIDSIQTLSMPSSDGVPGAPAQVREVALRLLRTAKTSGTALVLIGHVNKDSAVAGPKSLEHLVDAVFMLEGERQGSFRVLRASKNRFGPTDEIGLFEMREKGMIGIDSPTPLHEVAGERFGRAICPVLEGSRPLLVEVQALVAKAAYGTGRRIAVGVSDRRLATLLAVIERYADIDLGSHDVYVSTGAGVVVNETAIDAAVVSAIASSYWSTPLPEETAIFGEIALGGGLRRVRAVSSRAKEAVRQGFANLHGPAAPDAELPAAARYFTVSDVKQLLAGLGVLAPKGAKPVVAGGRNGPPVWMSGRRRSEEEVE